MKQFRLTEEQRRGVIVDAGLTVAKKEGLGCTTYEDVAEQCSITTSVGTVRVYFKTKAHLWRAIARHADATDDIKTMAKTLGVIK